MIRYWTDPDEGISSKLVEIVSFGDGSGIELPDGGVIEAPDVNSGVIRLRYRDGSCEIREPDETGPGYDEWFDLFETVTVRAYGGLGSLEQTFDVMAHELGPRKFYKTTVTFVVLSEEPIPPYTDLYHIAQEAAEGRYVGSFGASPEELLDGSEMAKALYEAGSEPGFFELDDDGNTAVE